VVLLYVCQDIGIHVLTKDACKIILPPNQPMHYHGAAYQYIQHPLRCGDSLANKIIARESNGILWQASGNRDDIIYKDILSLGRSIAPGLAPALSISYVVNNNTVMRLIFVVEIT